MKGVVRRRTDRSGRSGLRYEPTQIDGVNPLIIGAWHPRGTAVTTKEFQLVGLGEFEKLGVVCTLCRTRPTVGTFSIHAENLNSFVTYAWRCGEPSGQRTYIAAIRQWESQMIVQGRPFADQGPELEGIGRTREHISKFSLHLKRRLRLLGEGVPVRWE